MKKALSLILALVMCLSLCACGEDNSPDDLPEENTEKMGAINSNDGFYGLRGMNANEVALYYPGEWTFENHFADLPTKLNFKADGTCVATYNDQTKDLLWGYAPGSELSFNDLYVRVGTQEDILYLFRVYLQNSVYLGSIALHCFVSADGIPVEGLTEDGYEVLWVSGTQKGPEDNDKNEQTADNNDQTADSNEPAADSYEKIELTVENWDTYFELTEKAVFSKNLFGENDSLEIIHAYKLKEGYGSVGEETNIIMEYSYRCEDRLNSHIDYAAETYTLGECASYSNGTRIVDYSSFSDEGYGQHLEYSYDHDETNIKYCTNYEIIRVQGTLYLKKN